MRQERTIVLEQERIEDILMRFAHRIVEDFHKEKRVVFLGIKNNGFELAKSIKKNLDSISTIQSDLLSISLEKSEPHSREIEVSGSTESIANAVVILVDDVLNSGRTLVYSLARILEFNPKSISTFVLVDRIHRNFPVKADHVGMSLSTTIKERVELELNGQEAYAYLI